MLCGVAVGLAAAPRPELIESPGAGNVVSAAMREGLANITGLSKVVMSLTNPVCK